jgi:predicted nucleic acid-binding protein
MILMDVNVLVYAHREDVKDHLLYHEWLESVVNCKFAFGYSELVLSGFLRVVTHSKVFEQPSSLANT